MLRLFRGAAGAHMGLLGPTVLLRMAALTSPQYDAEAERTLQSIADAVERAADAINSRGGGSAADVDVSLESGVLTMSLPPPKGTFVINKQEPSLQLWYSSPVSGPKRFDFDAVQRKWVWSREGASEELINLLRRELRILLGRKIDI